MGAVLGLLAAAVLVAATAFFVAVEFSLVAVDRATVDVEADQGDRRSRLVGASLRRLSFHLSGVQLGITVCSVALGVLAEPGIASLLRGPLRSLLGVRWGNTTAIVTALVVATVVQMVVGELIPKAVALSRPLATAKSLAPAQRVYSWLSAPVVVLFGGVANGVVRLLGVEPTEELNQVRSRRELAILVEASGREGDLAQAEFDLLRRTFAFRDKTVAEALTPRTAVVALPRSATGHELRLLSARTGHSRVVIHDGDLDGVVGVVHVKRLSGLPVSERDTVSLADLVEEVPMVPESRSLSAMLEEMRSTRTHMAVVLDEYGGTAGIVTMEDLVEQIVGDIDDEHDRDLDSGITVWGDAVLVGGDAHADELYETLGFEMPSGEYETVAGWLLAVLGRIPVEGDAVEFDGWRFDVVEMDRRRILTIRAVRLTDEQSGVDS
ncbi:MAG: hemolysin family protein [Microthrixaceae bacterium]